MLSELLPEDAAIQSILDCGAEAGLLGAMFSPLWWHSPEPLDPTPGRGVPPVHICGLPYERRLAATILPTWAPASVPSHLDGRAPAPS